MCVRGVRTTHEDERRQLQVLFDKKDYGTRTADQRRG